MLLDKIKLPVQTSISLSDRGLSFFIFDFNYGFMYPPISISASLCPDFLEEIFGIYI